MKALRVAVLLAMVTVFMGCKFAGSMSKATPEVLSPPATLSLIPRLTSPPVQDGMAATPQAASASSTTGAPVEVAVQMIPLEGAAAQDRAEFSGMAWYGDQLILLPQYPDRFATNGADGALFALPRQTIITYLRGQDKQPLTPLTIPFYSNAIEKMIPGYEGFEAISFLGKHVFLAIEARKGLAMTGFLVRGLVEGDLTTIRLEIDTLTENPLQGTFGNKSDEAIFFADGNLITLYEINGAQFNPSPQAHRFNQDLKVLESLSFPNIEYRITDATDLDAQRRFWAINYFFPDDLDHKPASDPLAEQYGEGPTHAQYETVERLVEFQYTPNGILFSGAPPLQLQLATLGVARNWEGLARLDGMGFLLVTDKFPDTLLGFVPFP